MESKILKSIRSFKLQLGWFIFEDTTQGTKTTETTHKAGFITTENLKVQGADGINILGQNIKASAFGDMLITIKETFPQAVFFGFTGIPIQDENEKNLNTTATVFGHELHRYSI